MSNFFKVKKFMQKFKQEVKSKPSFPDENIIKLRINLIKEELLELEEALNVVMNKSEQDLWEFVETTRKEFRTLTPEEVAFPRGCKGLIQYQDSTNIYSKGTPIHVRGSLLFNNLLNKRNLDMRYETIKNGEKVHFTYLTLPNPINENVISFTTSLPREFDLHRFIDYDMQFDKSFTEPLKNIVQLINWNVEPVASLDSFFG